MLVRLKNNRKKKKNIPGDAGHFLNTEIHSTDFENETLTTKIGRNKEEKQYSFKKIFPKDLQIDQTIK